MRLLMLGGTHHVGRAVVETALARGDDVTTLNRGMTGRQQPGVRALHADRTDRAALSAALGDGTWDAVIDTWSGPPRAVADAAALLADRAGHYGYVSSRSVYRWPFPVGGDESAPVVDGDPASADADDYAAAKRGGELAAVAAFGDRALLARAGLILGPYEIVGRMPWWLRRLEQGGEVLAPGPPGRPLQYIDCRDLAAWMLAAARRRVRGNARRRRLCGLRGGPDLQAGRADRGGHLALAAGRGLPAARADSARPEPGQGTSRAGRPAPLTAAGRAVLA